jgi:hypothetical protein
LQGTDKVANNHMVVFLGQWSLSNSALTPEYAKQVLDKNHTRLISIQQIDKDPVILLKLPKPKSILCPNNTKAITNTHLS